MLRTPPLLNPRSPVTTVVNPHRAELRVGVGRGVGLTVQNLVGSSRFDPEWVSLSPRVGLDWERTTRGVRWVTGSRTRVPARRLWGGMWWGRVHPWSTGGL